MCPEFVPDWPPASFHTEEGSEQFPTKTALINDSPLFLHSGQCRIYRARDDDDGDGDDGDDGDESASLDHVLQEERGRHVSDRVERTCMRAR